MRKRSLWYIILNLLVGLFFIYNGILILLQGNYAFAIIWLLITGTIFIQALQGLLVYVKQRRKTELEHLNEEENGYQPTTVASLEKERLQKLEELYQSGFITKAEYDEKRSDIIEKL